MAEKKIQDPEKQRRTAVRQARSLKQVRQKRRRRKKLTRLAVYVLLAALAVLLILALVMIGRHIRSSRQERAVEEALQEEISNSSFYSASEVLHLSFPVLTLDGSTAEAGEALTEEETSEEEPGEEESEEGSEEESEEDSDESEEEGESEEGEEPEEDAETAVSDPVYPEPNLTVSEFGRILQDLYDRGYVLVDIYSLSEAGEDGYTSAQVMVPEGKKPLIISQQDVSYSADDRKHANAMVTDASGQVLCSYYDENGVETSGAVDVVPVLETFIAANPDFSCKGARGILGVTGYRGLLGYQIEEDTGVLGTIRIDKDGGGSTAAGGDLVGEGTGTAVSDDESALTAESEQNEEIFTAVESDAVISSSKTALDKVFTSLRSGGWHIASNGYGQVSYGSQFKLVKEDADKWQETIGPIVGTADILVLPEKADIGGWGNYSEENEKYQYLKELGFRQYCVEDEGAFTWAQVRPEYVRMGMHTIENYGEYTALMGTE